MRRYVVFFACNLALCLVLTAMGNAADWPTWRYDANRSAASPAELPAQMNLQWKRELPPPRPAFPQDRRLCFDISYEPVVMGKTMFVPSMVTDSVIALDTETGAERWVFYADGPVRFAPVAWSGKVYFVADDGDLYCLDAQDGRLLWKFCGIPPGREGYKLLGNERLISRWPARGGPVLADGTVYFANGIWPFEGVYVYAVSAETGRMVWANKDCGYIKDGQLDHGAAYDGGLSPQGYLASVAETLVVPSGKALPGFFDLKSGRLEAYCSGWGGRVALSKGLWYACGIGEYLFHGGDVFAMRAAPDLIGEPQGSGQLVSPEDFARQMNMSLEQVERLVKERPLAALERDGKRFIRIGPCPPETYLSWWLRKPRPGAKHMLDVHPRLQLDPANDKELVAFREPVLTEDAIYYSQPAHDMRGLSGTKRRDLSYKEIVAYGITKPPKWETTYQGGVVDPKPEILVGWRTGSFDQLWSMASNLKVHIKAGPRLYAGGPGVVAAVDIPKPGEEPKVSWQTEIEGAPSRMLAADDKLFVVTQEGSIYCFGGEMAEAKAYAAAKPSFTSAEDDWTRAADEILKPCGVNQGYCLVLGVGTGRLVEELARQSGLEIIVLEPDMERVAAARQKFGGMGLYGTRVHIVPGDLLSLHLTPYMASLIVAEGVKEAGLDRGKAFVEGLFASLRPFGGAACLPIPQADHDAFVEWVKSLDLAGSDVKRQGDFTLLRRVGPLPGSADWTHQFGDAGNTFTSKDQLAKPPFGVLWFGGAVDHLITETAPPLISCGRMFLVFGREIHATDIYTGQHLWKQTLSSAGRWAAAEDGIYVTSGRSCLWLDAATGAKRGQVNVPPEAKKASWTEIRVSGDRLIGTAGKNIFCMDRRTGEMRWSFPCEKDGLSLAAGAGRVFCMNYRASALKQLAATIKAEESSVIALDAASGQVLWQAAVRPPSDTADAKAKKTFLLPSPPFLTYCAGSDILLASWKGFTLCAYDGKTGEALWTKNIPYSDPPSGFGTPQPPILLPELLITHGGEMYDARTGSKLPKRLWKGMNVSLRGCGRALASPNIVTVRDADASYYDLATGRHSFLRGIRSGCLNTLIPAGGLLNAPYFARHCSCNYPIATSLALVPMPEAEEWDIQ